MQILSQIISLRNACYIKISHKLIQNLSEISRNSNSRVVSLDISNVYTSIPTHKLKCIIDNIPDLSSINNKLVWQNNTTSYISHNGKMSLH